MLHLPMQSLQLEDSQTIQNCPTSIEQQLKKLWGKNEGGGHC